MKIEIPRRRVEAMHCATCALASLLESFSPRARSIDAETRRAEVRTRIAIAEYRQQQARIRRRKQNG